jgi:hypothetical protein
MLAETLWGAGEDLLVGCGQPIFRAFSTVVDSFQKTVESLRKEDQMSAILSRSVLKFHYFFAKTSSELLADGSEPNRVAAKVL